MTQVTQHDREAKLLLADYQDHYDMNHLSCSRSTLCLCQAYSKWSWSGNTNVNILSSK